MPIRHIASLVVLVFLGTAVSAGAQAAAVPSSQDAGSSPANPTWSLRVSSTAYFVPNEENYVQPTFAADRGGLHLEARYNYEDHKSISGFVGWNLEFGDTVKLALTPMVGVVTGRTDGVIPALTLDLTWKRLEFYSEGEYLIDAHRQRNNFVYTWSELSVWSTDWLRAGLVTQQTRTFRPFNSTRDIQRGLLVGVAGSWFEGAFYLFNPGLDDQFTVASIIASF